jgi:hypothetical protein
MCDSRSLSWCGNKKSCEQLGSDAAPFFLFVLFQLTRISPRTNASNMKPGCVGGDARPYRWWESSGASELAGVALALSLRRSRKKALMSSSGQRGSPFKLWMSE